LKPIHIIQNNSQRVINPESQEGLKLHVGYLRLDDGGDG
jgi:hypothetical protein